MSGELIVKYNTEKYGEVTITYDDVKKLLAPGQQLTDGEVRTFIELCRIKKLNPWIKEVYIVKYNNDFSIIVSKDVFLKRAERHPMFTGMDAGIIVGTKYDDVMAKDKVAIKAGERVIVHRAGTLLLDSEMLLGGWCSVRRKDRDEPHLATVSVKEYVKLKDGRPTRFWASMQATMIRKVAIVHALRESFPDDLSGMYTEDEMLRQDKNIEAVAYEAPTGLVDAIWDLGESLGYNQGQIRQNLNRYKGKEEELKDLWEAQLAEQQAVEAAAAGEEAK